MIVLIFILSMFTEMHTVRAQKNFYDFKVFNIDGEEVSLAQFKGKKVLVVNVASKCGYTPQYEGLEKLYETFGGEKFTIIGFPANNFMWQEPGTNEEIKEFCTSKYNVTFPMMAKISVSGIDQDPLYKWLTKAAENGVADAKVKWNFQKFLIGEDGQWLTYFPSKIEPMSDEITNWLKNK